MLRPTPKEYTIFVFSSKNVSFNIALFNSVTNTYMETNESNECNIEETLNSPDFSLL